MRQRNPKAKLLVAVCSSGVRGGGRRGVIGLTELLILAGAVGLLLLVVSSNRPPRLSDKSVLSHAGIEVLPVFREKVLQTEEFALPFELAVVDTLLVVLDLASDSVFHVVHRETGRFVGNFGRRGEGPGEFKGAWSLDPKSGDESGVWVYDIRLLRSTFVNLEAALGGQTIASRPMMSFDREFVLTGPLEMDTDTFVSLGFLPEGRLGVFNRQGQHVTTRASLPPNTKNLPIWHHQHAYQATLVPHPARQLLAAATRHGTDIEIFGSGGTLIHRLHGPIGIDVRENVFESGRFRLNGNMRFGYVDAAASEDFIFALFSGRTSAEFRGRANFGRFVHVFDWAGEFRVALQLDVDAIAIGVRADSRELYVVVHDPQPGIVWFALPHLPGSVEAHVSTPIRTDDQD